jgi:hypothetical protein
MECVSAARAILISTWECPFAVRGAQYDISTSAGKRRGGARQSRRPCPPAIKLIADDQVYLHIQAGAASEARRVIVWVDDGQVHRADRHVVFALQPRHAYPRVAYTELRLKYRHAWQGCSLLFS